MISRLFLYLWLLVTLLSVVAVRAQPAASPPAPTDQVAVRSTDTPATIFATARHFQQRGLAFPEPLLRMAVEGAFQGQAPWIDTEAAIGAFDLYKNRPWVMPAMAPFVSRYGSTVLLNAPYFASLHREWTQRIIERTAAHTPALVLSELRALAAVDAIWAKKLAEAAARSAPPLVFDHVQSLLEVDRQWTHSLLEVVAQVVPRRAVQAVHTYGQEPWGAELFANAVLQDPQGVVNMIVVPSTGADAVMEALQRATDPHVQMLLQIAQSPYPEPVRERMAIFVYDLVNGQRSLQDAAQRSADTQRYFDTLVAMKLAHPQRLAVELALKDHVLGLIEPINSQFERPDAVRFRAVATYTAQALYVLIAYSTEEVFTSSYRGLFERLLARMRHENLSGDALLAQAHDVHFQAFIKSLASFNRLTDFLATLSSPVARLVLLARCFRDLGVTTPGAMERVLTAAEILNAALDVPSQRLLRDVILNEYTAAQHRPDAHAMAIYGLLAAWLAQRLETTLQTSALVGLAARYRAYLPNFRMLPITTLFPQGRNVQRHFFYNDDDGRLSFHSFLAQYRSAKAWHISEQDTYVHLQAHTQERNLEIYANTPEHDITTGDVLAPLFQERRLLPTVVVHRGHSTHVTNTITALPSTAAVVFLGNCGSYALLEAALTQAPQAHMITTKGIGTITVNDPLLKMLNETLLRGRDIVWEEFWKQAESALGRNPRFLDYLPPDKNASVIFLRAYRALMAAQEPR